MRTRWIKVMGLGALLLGAACLQAHDDDKAMGGGMMEMMQKKLDLSDAQATKLKESGKANREAMKGLHEKLKTDMDELRLLVDKKGSDAKLTAVLAALKKDRDALQAQQKKHTDALQKILTPMQQAKLVLGMEKRMHQGMDHWKKGKWGGHEDKDDEDDDRDEDDDHAGHDPK